MSFNVICLKCDTFHFNVTHLKCSDLTHSQFSNLCKTRTTYYCAKCLSEELPFQLLSNDELSESTRMDFDILKQLNLTCESEFYESLPFIPECQYRSTDWLSYHMKQTKHSRLSVIHFNIVSLTKNKTKIEVRRNSSVSFEIDFI